VCVAGTNPPQPKGPKREPTQQTHGRTGTHGPNGAPTRRPPPEKAIAFFGFLYLGGPLHEGGINEGRCGTASRDQSIPEQTHFFIH
jgi:hypothetical protein